MGWFKRGGMRIFLSLIFSFLFLLGAETAAFAQSNDNLAPGCGADQYAAMQAAADAHAAQQVAIHEEILAPSDSVLATSCFDQAARVSASEGGEIFSGNFMDAMAPVVLQPLQNLLQENFLGSIGKDPDFGNVVLNALATLLSGLFGGFFSSGSFNCSVQQDIYRAVMVSGINGNIQLPSADQLIALALGGGGDSNRYMAGLVAAQDIFINLQQSVDNLAVPSTPSMQNLRGFEDILRSIGIQDAGMNP